MNGNRPKGPSKTEISDPLQVSVDGEVAKLPKTGNRPLNVAYKVYPSHIKTFLPPIIRHSFWHMRHRFAQAVRYESDTGAKFQTLPVAFGLGTLAYYSLPREPLLTALLLALAISIAIAVKTYGRLSGNIALIAICIFGGMTAGKIRTDIVDTRMIERPVRATITGLVLNRELRPKNRIRYTIKITSMDARTRVVPQTVRVSARGKYPLIEIGAGISGLVSLRPPSGPAYPGAYDFAFQNWFKGVGANGFFMGEPKAATVAVSLPWMARAALMISSVRADIATRIRDSLPGEKGSLATALIVGDRSGIGEDTAEALRLSGLAHILAISGLHMALVTATIIFLTRGILAMIPGIALYYPIRKWAAGAALFFATLYLIISGASVATQRAWIMIVIMLVAILLDRRALTMRNVGIAALIVLIWRPESIVSPGFQMSFAAVAALIATYETWSRYRRNKAYQPPSSRWHAIILAGFKGMSGLAVTSLVAGFATGLFAAYHFYRFAPLGLVANLAAMPLVSLVVMPMALVSMILMPFGLEQYGLVIMGKAIEMVVAVARWVAERGPSGNTGFLPLAALVYGTLALIVATQLKSRLRLLSLPIALAALLFFSLRQFPDIIISESGSSVAIRDHDGQLQLLNPRKEKFITNIWRKAFAPGQGGLKKSGLFRCDELGCTAIIDSNIVLAIPKRQEALREDCTRANIIVTRLVVPGWCNGPQTIIDRKALQGRGGHTIQITQGTPSQIPAIRISRSISRFKRPWSRHRR